MCGGDFPEYLKLYPSRKKIILLLVCSFAFVSGGIFMAIEEGGIIPWLCICFFGLGVGVFAAQLLPGCSFLELDTNGFTMCALFRKHRNAWSDIADFGVLEMTMNGSSVNKTVGFSFVKGYESSQRARKVSAFISDGAERALADTYGYKAEELTELMREFKLRYGVIEGNRELTRDMVVRKVAQCWGEREVDQVMELLDSYGLEDCEKEVERVQLAILKLSGGDKVQLSELVEQAKVDYRDMLAYSEYPEEMAVGFDGANALSEEEIAEIRVRDRKQFIEWLESNDVSNFD